MAIRRFEDKQPQLANSVYIDEAALCDRIALIQDGEILEIDTPQEIVKHYPKTIYNVKG